MTAAFFPYGAIWRLAQRKAHYLIRVSKQIAQLPKRIKRLNQDDWEVRFRPSVYSRRKCPGLPEEIICRLVRYQRRGFRSSWLLTSLMDSDLCSRDELVDLYHRRWSVETIYREWKHGLNIQNLRSRTPRGILKEIHAQLILSNLLRWKMTEAAAQTEQHPVDLSFLTTLTLIRQAFGTPAVRSISCRAELSDNLLRAIRKATIRKRPGRSYPRLNDGKIKNKGEGKYQQPARLVRKKIA